MALSNLFSPNDYDIFCHSITPSGGGSGIFTNYIDSVNVGDSMAIGTIKAGNMFIGSATNIVTFQSINVGLRVATNQISALTPVSMIIGTNAAGLSLLPASGDITIDDNAPTANVLHLGDTNIGTVRLGKVGGSNQSLAPLFLSGGISSLNTYDEMVAISGTGTGCIPNTANFIQFKAQKVNTIVRFFWRFLGPAVNATAAAALSIVETVPGAFRPFATVSYPASLTGTPLAPMTPAAGLSLPGLITVSSAGVISFFFIAATHPQPANTANINYAVGESVAVGSGSATWSTVA